MVSSIKIQAARRKLSSQGNNHLPPHAVIHFDTEQSVFDHWALISRVIRRAGEKDAPPWLRSHCLTDLRISDRRAAVRLMLNRNAQSFGGIHSLIIDGVADLVADVNDPVETADFVAELHAQAISYACAVLVNIHLNPGSGFKTRGHLGSQLERKGETNLRLEKDANGITTLWADKNRRAPIPKAIAPRFEWSEAHQMHISTIKLRDGREAAALNILRDQIKAAFQFANNQALPWSDLTSALRRIPGINSQRTAERKHTNAVKAGIICQDRIGNWVIA